MKSSIIKYMLRFSYPQSIFASTIFRFIDKNAKNELVDVPCGGGITSWRFSKLKNLTVYGYDINPDSIQNAKCNFQRSNLFFEAADINNAIPKHINAKYFCIINSLFLLPEPDSILASIKAAMQNDSMLFIIVPNSNGHNFKWFEKHNAGVNKHIIQKEEFQHYFISRGFELQKNIPIAYTQSYGRADVALFSVVAPFYLRILNYIQTLLRIGTPNYFLLALKKGK